MRAGCFPYRGQKWLVLFVLFCGCGPSEGSSSAPPLTSPLSRSVIGYAVITASYVRVVDEPGSGVSLGYLRSGSIVRVLERRALNTKDGVESWVLAEGDYRGWFREAAARIYDNEAQAETAAGLLAE